MFFNQFLAIIKQTVVLISGNNYPFEAYLLNIPSTLIPEPHFFKVINILSGKVAVAFINLQYKRIGKMHDKIISTRHIQF